jgi:hypothetical protein
MRIRDNGSRWTIALLCALLVVLAAGCGGGDSASSEDVAAVEAGVVALGTTQNVSCEVLGDETVGGVERQVFTCGFEEEMSAQAGEMRAARRCFVLEENGAVEDVTNELRSKGSCPVTSG